MAFEVIKGTLPAQAAGGATSITILGTTPSTFSSPGAAVQKLSLSSPTLVTGVATDNVTYNFRKVHAGGSPVVLGTLTLSASTVTLPAEVEKNVTIAVSSLADGDVIDVQMVQNGAGLDSPAGVVASVELQDL